MKENTTNASNRKNTNLSPLIIPDSNKQDEFSLILVTSILTLQLWHGWSIQSTTPTPFPGKQRNANDRRSELAKEIISILFELNFGPTSKQIKSSSGHSVLIMLTPLGVLIVDPLHLSNGDERVYDLKLQVLILWIGVTDEETSTTSISSL